MVFLFSLLLAMAATAKTDSPSLRFSGLSLGVGDWITLTDQQSATREDYGTLPSLGLYFQAWDWNGSLSLPVKSTFKRVRHDTRFSLGDGEISLGRKWGGVSPRLTLKVPLYSWSVEDALENELFVGSGNVNLALGLGSKLPKGFLPPAWTLAADIEVSTAVTEALADFGSSHVIGVTQLSYAFAKRWKVGVNSLFLFDYWRWIPSYWDQKGETKFSIVPGAVVGVKCFRATYVDVKAGASVYDYRDLYRPKFRNLPQSSVYASLSLYQGF